VRHDPARVIAASSQAEARDPARRRTWVALDVGAGHQLDLIRAEAAHRERRYRRSMQAHHRRQTLHHRSEVGLAGSEAVLTLRAVISNGDFDDYWRFRLAREHQRLYPAQPRASTHSAPDLPLCSILPYQPTGNAGAGRKLPPGPPARNQHCRRR
jgi:hypothetical protein